jgi:hypothetical protein
VEPVEHTFSIRIEFAPALPADDNALCWLDRPPHGGSPIVIGELVGNRSDATLKRYNHLLDSPLKESTE